MSSRGDPVHLGHLRIAAVARRRQYRKNGDVVERVRAPIGWRWGETREVRAAIAGIVLPGQQLPALGRGSRDDAAIGHIKLHVNQHLLADGTIIANRETVPPRLHMFKVGDLDQGDGQIPSVVLRGIEAAPERNAVRVGIAEYHFRVTHLYPIGTGAKHPVLDRRLVLNR